MSLITLNYRDARPIYRQIEDAFKNLMISGALPAGEKMPSVRDLATQLAINPNTIQRAYRELEADGYIYTVSGRGTFVAEVEELGKNRKRELLALLDGTVQELMNLGVSREELAARIEKGGESHD